MHNRFSFSIYLFSHLTVYHEHLSSEQLKYCQFQTARLLEIIRTYFRLLKILTLQSKVISLLDAFLRLLNFNFILLCSFIQQLFIEHLLDVPNTRATVYVFRDYTSSGDDRQLMYNCVINYFIIIVLSAQREKNATEHITSLLVSDQSIRVRKGSPEDMNLSRNLKEGQKL